LSLAQRRILCRLAVGAPATVSVPELEEVLWGDDPPATSRAAIQNQVSRLRARLGADAVLTEGRGYRLGLPADLTEAADDLRAAEAAVEEGAAPTAHERAERALGRWRGRPLDELDDLPAAEALRGHLREVRRSLEDVRLAAALGMGRARWAIAEAERLVAAEPGDEHRWAMLAGALAAAGRRGDALAALDRAQRSLARDLGLLPGPELRAAQAMILETEPGVAGAAPGRLVGRDDEVRAVLAALEAGVDVVVVGEAGSGRSALVAEVLRRLRRSGRRAIGAATSEHPASPLSTLIELVDELGARPDDRLAPVDRFVDTLVREVEARGPIVVAVDGVERSGPTTQAALAAAAVHDGITLLLTADREPLWTAGSDPARVVPLPPLDVAAVAELAATFLPDELGSSAGPIDVAWLHRMSGGNPVLLASLLVDPAVLDHLRGGEAQQGLPPAPGVRELVRRRVAHLGPEGRAALEAAAVCGTSSPVAVVIGLSSGGGVAEVLAAGLLRADGEQLQFRHDAIQRVVADDVPRGFRIELHHRAAAASDRLGAPAATVALHAVAATELDPVAARRWALRAATAASEAGAHADAAEWCERAVAVASSSPALGPRDLVEAMVRRGDALRLAGSAEQDHALFEAAEAAISLGDVGLLGAAAFAALQLGATTESGAVHERAMVLAEHALTVVTDPDERARIGAAASLMYSMTSRPERCRELFLAAEAAATSSSARRAVLPFAYLALGHPADLDDRDRITRELHALAVAADDPVARFEAAQLTISVAIQRAEGGRVRRSLAELEDLTPRVGDVGRRWALAYQRSALAHLEGDLARSEELAELALVTFADVSPSRAFATYAAQLLPLRLAARRLGELADQLEALVADQPGVPAWHAALALSVAPTDRDAAHRHATLALDRAAPDFTWLAAHVIGGRAAAQLDDEELVQRYIDRLEPWSGRVCWAGTCAYGPVDSVLALLVEALGRPGPAAVLAGQARDTARRLGAPVFLDELRRFAG
ncbi:MAG TPA: BTAD domain-containing putative transcriptional regulator, partial [Iamia sp.]|nr:BTAD domain-containing putative transcriptional regulator [Iamia sp.]